MLPLGSRQKVRKGKEKGDGLRERMAFLSHRCGPHKSKKPSSLRADWNR